MSESDVSARDALAIAQRSLARFQEVEDELRGDLEETNETVDQLQDDLTAIRAPSLQTRRSATQPYRHA
ncbi:hypothetical protein [Halorubrum sp. FL23]|uniref:hypothetical protein n=1 Tax=Halorubrum sp. FL23 TaxID=3458704 RepID=UPI004034208C